MKRPGWLWVCALGLLVLTGLARGQDDVARATALAEKDAGEERYKRLNTAVEDLQAAQVAIQKRLADLVEEIRALREEHTRASNRSVSREEGKRLWEAVQEIDQKREADKKQILKAIEELAKEATVVLPAPVPAPSPKSNAGIEKGYWHTVEAGQNLSLILQAYREQQGVKVTRKQVLEANPNLSHADKLRVGQRIFIPDPSK